MKVWFNLIIFILTVVFCKSTFGQYISHHTERDKIKIDTLIDKNNGDKFIIDKQRIYITAIDKNGKLLWKTDPINDNKIKRYKSKRPTIIYFALEQEKRNKLKEVIYIAYDNTQFGYLDKKNGKFIFEGQD